MAWRKSAWDKNLHYAPDTVTAKAGFFSVAVSVWNQKVKVLWTHEPQCMVRGVTWALQGTASSCSARLVVLAHSWSGQKDKEGARPWQKLSRA